MSKTFLVLCHPLETSLNSAVFQMLRGELEKSGKAVAYSDLYRDNYFPGMMDQKYYEGEVQKIQESDMVILQFPMYFSGFPAVLQDWIIEVLLKNPQVIEGKKVLLSITAGGSQSDYSCTGDRGSLDKILSPLLDFVFKDSFLLQPFIIFSCNGSNREGISKKISFLQGEVPNFSNWPVKHTLIEA